MKRGRPVEVSDNPITHPIGPLEDALSRVQVARSHLDDVATIAVWSLDDDRTGTIAEAAARIKLMRWSLDQLEDKIREKIEVEKQRF